MRPAQTGPEVESFYSLSDVTLDHRVCRGTSCFAAKQQNQERWRMAMSQWPPVYCLGKCYASPSSTETLDQPHVEVCSKEAIVLMGVVDQSMVDLASYRSHGGYEALETARHHTSHWVIEQVDRSNLRGRGGAGFPAGKKWMAVANQTILPKYVIANADEGDHGSYIDRFIIERVPHRLIEALAISAFAVGADKGYIYLRKEYPVAQAKLEIALSEVKSAGILGDFEIELVIGQGSYVCGEETSLLNSIEHRRPEVRARPPFPTESGLFHCPTLINNVETLSSIPWIILHGSEAYTNLGFSKSRGTKAISLNSLFNRPGLYEVEFGIPVRTIVEEIGGGLRIGDIKALMIGGPIVGLLHPSEFDTLFGFEELRQVGGAIGHGGIVAFDSSTRMIELLAHEFEFGAQESCGKCTPCRHGSHRIQELLSQASMGQPLTSSEGSELRSILDALRRTSLCGHGTGLSVLAASVLEKFSEELQPCFM